MNHKLKKLLRLPYDIYSYNIKSKFKILKPQKLVIVLTYHCNSRCVMCNIWKMDTTNEMSLEQWQQLLKDPIFQTIQSVSITGGEALLSPHCIPIIAFLRKTMPKLSALEIVSNGFATDLIKRKVDTIADFCRQNNIKFSIAISLDGVGKKHEEVRRIPFAYDKVINTLTELKLLQKKYKFSLIVASVIMKQTLPHIPKLQMWSSSNSIPVYFQLVGFHDSYLQNRNQKSETEIPASNKSQLLEFLGDMGKPKSITNLESYYWKDMYNMYKDGAPRTTPCPFQYDEFAIDAFGNIYNCLSEHSIGNFLKTRSVSKIYFDPENIKLREFVKKFRCPTCNSDCDIRRGIAYDAKHYLWFILTGSPWYGRAYHWNKVLTSLKIRST